MSRSEPEVVRTPSGDRDSGVPRPPRRFRRAASVRGALGVTLLGAVLPGAGYLWTRRRLGYVVLLPFLLTLGLVAVFAHDLDSWLVLAFDPVRLRIAAIVTSAAVAVWAFTVVTTFLMARPAGTRRLHTRLGLVVACLLCFTMALPVAQGVRYARTQADLVAHVFEDNRSATVPHDTTREDPWGGRERVSVLLLGGDGAVRRSGIRTDTMILLSVDTRTGRAVMFSLPRNLMNAQFPEGSPLREVFPEGFTGDGDPGAWMLNAVYGQVPVMHPGLLGESDNEGADALKQAVAGSLGTEVDYYLLVNLLGFQQLVDAIGGVTVNINEPVAINGDTDRGVPPTGYLEPGPDQHLNGYQALWYTRGRWGSDDYERMLRQRCMVDALVEEAAPLNLLRRYQALAHAGQEIVRTDIPQHLLPAFVNLGLKMKDRKLRSIAFVSSERFFPGDPDFAWMQSVVDRALAPRERADGDGRRNPGRAVQAADACAYDPVDGSAP